MNRALLDVLRCPGNHEESWLVSLVKVVDGSSLLEGELACPLCGAEYPVRGGVGVFGPSQADEADIGTGAQIEGSVEVQEVERLAAQLGVMGGRDPVLLHGRYAQMANEYVGLTEAPVVVIGTTDMTHAATRYRSDVSVLQVGERLPLGAGTLRAAAVDSMDGAPGLLTSVVAALRQGARLVLPLGVEQCDSVQRYVQEIARDDREWVGECSVKASGLVTLRRQPPAV